MTIPSTFTGIGYTRPKQGLPLEAIEVAVPRPAPDQVLVEVAYSSINPIDYKLAELNFLGRTPPVILGFDLAGVVVAIGSAVTRFAIGDEVAAMADSNGDGGWATGGHGYAVARDYLTVKRPAALAPADAAALPLCTIAAVLGLDGNVSPGDTVYIPGGGGGVGHLAVQLAARVYGARVVSSGSTPASIAVARASGAELVLDYKTDDVAARIAEATGGRGADAVYDTTYSERSFADTAAMVRPGGRWIVLGVGPGKTSRGAETATPVFDTLKARDARYINANMLARYTQPTRVSDADKAMLRGTLEAAVTRAVAGEVVPHISRVITSTLDAINGELGRMKSGGALGKIVIQL